MARKLFDSFPRIVRSCHATLPFHTLFSWSFFPLLFIYFIRRQEGLTNESCLRRMNEWALLLGIFSDSGNRFDGSTTSDSWELIDVPLLSIFCDLLFLFLCFFVCNSMFLNIFSISWLVRYKISSGDIGAMVPLNFKGLVIVSGQY